VAPHAPADGHRVAIPPPPVTLRPVDPTTFVVWSSQREQGGTVPQPAPSLTLALELTTVLDGVAAPARLDVEAYFVAQQVAEGLPPPRAEVSGVSHVVTATFVREEWTADAPVVAALAEATRAPEVAAPAAPVPAAAGEEREPDTRQGSQEKGRLLVRAAAWLLVTRAVCGLWGSWGWPEPIQSGETSRRRTDPLLRSPASGGT
jgi:hypothetical protein